MPSARRRRVAGRGSPRRRAALWTLPGTGSQPPRLQHAREELTRPLLAWRREDLLGRSLLVDDAGFEEADLARHLARETHLVGGEDHGHPGLRELADELEHLADQLRVERRGDLVQQHQLRSGRERKSTRLNSSHANISYAVFCLKKKK